MEERKLGNIALSLSGGGYRAAAFHLGTLEMLNELGLKDDIKVLSTVSGGSITGAAFAASLADGTPFAEFRAKLYAFLAGTNVITAGIDELLANTKINGIDVMPSLIRSAANVYARDGLLGGRTLASLRSSKSKIEEIVINTTDFHSGNSFRFQVSSNPNIRSGNNSAEISTEINGTIRAADAVAASACFPSGFEPLRFPGEFFWGKGTVLEGIRDVLGRGFDEDIPLMDGGIFDNQGIDSIRNISKRENSNVDVFIISDTSQRSGDLLDYPVKQRSGVISIRTWYWLMVLLAIGSFVTLIATVWDFVFAWTNGQLDPYRFFVTFLIPFLLSFGVFVLIVYGRIKFRSAAVEVQNKTGVQLWSSIKSLTIPELTELVASRVRSVIVLTSSVFMRRLRALAFERVFADTDLNKKLIPNLIYDIDNVSRWGDEIVKGGYSPVQTLRDLACQAESYETNLWFLDAQDLDRLIACGRATICFKILKYLIREKSVEISNQRTGEYKFIQTIKEKWQELNRS